jgi:prephenate dehydratase
MNMDNKKIAFLGPEGTFTEEALIKYIKDLKEYEKMPISTIQDVIKSVDRGEAWLGVVPMENSIEGSVNVTQDILTFESDAKIIGEITIPIRHHLIGKKGTRIKNIKKILSHPHATAQCRVFLASKCSDCEIMAANSTAEAVKKLLNSESDTAAIGTKIAAGIYDLEILSSDIEDNK